MEFVLLGLLVLSFPVIAIVALVKAVGLNDRLRRMELRFVALEGRIAAGPVAAEPAAKRPAPVAPVAPPPPPPPDVAEPPAATSVPPVAAAAPKDIPPAAPPAHVAGFEERFGTRWVVWIGGLALALGGIFLVRYSIEQGLIGPGMRLFFGALLAAALIAAGEWTRRKENRAGVTGLPTAYIPGILTAAGTTVAYATVYAAYGLYGFLAPAAAFVLLGIVALATLGAALLHGPALAALGLVGAYVTPLLVAARAPNFWALYLYLTVVTAAAFALARIRMWRWLALTAVAFGVFWLLPGLSDARLHSLMPHEFHVIAGYGLVAAAIVAGLFYGPTAAPGRIDAVSCIALSAYLAGAMLLVMVTRHDLAALAVFTALTVATVAIAWRTEAATAAAAFAAALAALVIIRWSLEPDVLRLVAAPNVSAAPTAWRADVTAHLTFGAIFAGLFGLAGLLAQGRSVAAAAPILWSAAGVLTPLLILIALYYRISGVERSIPFAAIALALASLNAWITEHLSKREPRPGLAAATALYATGAVAALCLALTFALDKGFLSVGLALMVPGIAWVAEKRPLPMLRVLAAILVAIVAARTAWEPRIAGAGIGTTPVFNWILYGYGVPAAAFWLGGMILRRRGDNKPARTVESGAILFTVLVFFLEIRHWVNGGDIYSDAGGVAEVALQVCTGLAMAIGLEHVRLRTGSIVHDIGALIVAGLTLCGIVFGLWIGVNPLFTAEPVGGPFINLVLLGYGLPAVLAIVLAMTTRERRPNVYRIGAAVVAVLMMLIYLSLEVRTLFHGTDISSGRAGDAEQYSYSVVWLAYGVALLLFGIVFRSQPARLASAAITTLTVAKVFLIDMSDLTGVYRALSFIGLGLVLVSIGWLYQKLLFPRRGGAFPPQT